MEIRRKDRQLDDQTALKILSGCEYATFATINQDGSPYCIPISPVYFEGFLYFHCAMEGHKLENIKRDNRVCVCCAGNVKPIPEQFTTEYESAVVFGRAEIVKDQEEKILALRKLCLKYAASNMNNFDRAVKASLERTCICKISIEELTGKAKRQK